jgi:hypothetical protein
MRKIDSAEKNCFADEWNAGQSTAAMTRRLADQEDARADGIHLLQIESQVVAADCARVLVVRAIRQLNR